MEGERGQHSGTPQSELLHGHQEVIITLQIFIIHNHSRNQTENFK